MWQSLRARYGHLTRSGIRRNHEQPYRPIVSTTKTRSQRQEDGRSKWFGKEVSCTNNSPGRPLVNLVEKSDTNTAFTLLKPLRLCMKARVMFSPAPKKYFTSSKKRMKAGSVSLLFAVATWIDQFVFSELDLGGISQCDVAEARKVRCCLNSVGLGRCLRSLMAHSGLKRAEECMGDRLVAENGVR